MTDEEMVKFFGKVGRAAAEVFIHDYYGIKIQERNHLYIKKKSCP